MCDNFLFFNVSIENKVLLDKKDTEDEEVEDYEVWKKRILDEAYEALSKRTKTTLPIFK